MEINRLDFRIILKKPVLFVAAVLLVLGLAVAGYWIKRGDGEIIVSKSQEQTTRAANQTGSSSALPEDIKPESAPERDPEDEIKVYVTGCVKKEGIVTLKKGQLIDDAIKAAGGATEEADLENINLVYKLNSNVSLKIKSKNSSPGEKNAEVSTSKPETPLPSGEAGTGAVLMKEDGGAIVNSTAQSGETNGKININTATLEQLDTLPGIGASTAGDIIAYRDKNGPFKTINDIMKVSGIKESRFSKIKDLITAD